MFKLKALATVAAIVGFAPLAQADIIFVPGQSDLAAQFYLSQNYGEIKDSVGNNLTDGGLIAHTGAPQGATTQSINLSASGSSLSGTASSVIDGFAHARASATTTITNASSNQGYTTVASQGSRTQVLFDSSATPGKVVFNFKVTGSFAEPYGESLSRLDFLARSSTSGSFFDVFGAGALHATGTGTFSFTYLGSTVDPLDILFYSAAAVLIGTSDFPAAPDGATFTSFAEFGSTFDLESILLYTAADQLITDWSMTDLATNQVVFDENGRIPVPEPGALALLGLGLVGLALSRRRSSR